MNHLLERVTQQRHQEGRSLKIFITSSLMGSLACHAFALNVPWGNPWSLHSIPETIDEIEIQVMDLAVPEEALIPEELPEEIIPETIEEVLPDPIPPEPELVAEPPPLAPETALLEPVGEDAPTSEPAALLSDPLAAVTSPTGDLAVSGSATGSLTDPNGQGSGFGNNDRPTGFASGGTSTGAVNGSPNGIPGGTGATGTPTAAAAVVKPTPTPSVISQPAPQLRCLSCPKPDYQGVEGSPKVDLRIRADGSVEVRLRESSGDPEVDRATLEAMSQWQFDPDTIPEEGVQQRVRVTYEEEGSRFQRENERRRREEAKRQQEWEQQRAAELAAEEAAARELAEQEAERQRQLAEQNRLDQEQSPILPEASEELPQDPVDPVIPLEEPVEDYIPDPVQPAIEEAPLELPPEPVEEYIPEPEPEPEPVVEESIPEPEPVEEAPQE